MNVVLMVLDTQRADRLGCYGDERPISPNIDGIAADGVVFERCYVPNIPTHPSFTTMLTGKEAITHDIVNIGGGVPIRDGVRLLPEILSEAGYATAAIDQMGRHFTRGFDQYHTYDWDRSDPTVLRKADAVNEKAIPVLRDLIGQEQPFFCFMHYWDPHTPWLPPPDYRELYYPADRDPYDVNNDSMTEAWTWEPFRWYFHDWMPGITDVDYVKNLYDGEVTYLDHKLREVFDVLEPVRDDTLLIITADHGEILDEQLGWFDHHGLYEQTTRVPLIMRLPGRLPAGKRVPGYVQNLDLSQTILDLAGIPQRDNMEGLSLVPSMFGARDGNYEEIYLSEATWQAKRAIRTDRWKLIRSIEQDPHGRPMKELFDLHADPGEQENLAESRPEIVKELEAKLDAWIASRLAETGRTVDPVAEQGASAKRIGQPKEGEVVGPGAIPLAKRAGLAADIPAADKLDGSAD